MCEGLTRDFGHAMPQLIVYKSEDQMWDFCKLSVDQTTHQSNLDLKALFSPSHIYLLLSWNPHRYTNLSDY